jgi:Carbohydrate family 9 binding domain-like
MTRARERAGLMTNFRRSVSVLGSMAILGTVTLGATSLACVGGSKGGLTSEDKDRLKPYILDQVPADIPHKIDINFENKIHLIGYKFDPETAKPGADVKLTYWWRCDDTVEEGWGLFTHLHEESSDRSDNLDGVGPLREQKNGHEIMGPDHWEKGKVYVDEQDYKMPDWIKGPDLTVLLGIWKGEARLRIVSGANDGDNRAIVGKIKTGLAPAPAEAPHTSNELPKMNANKLAAGDKIVIDGKGDDKAWGVATSTGPFVDVGTGKPNTSFPVNASAKVAWDDTNLYILVEVSDPDVVGYFTSPDKQKDDWTVAGQPKLWTKDTVELMVDPDGDNKDYYEIQINPQNKQFHTQYDSYNQPKTEPNGPFGHEDWKPNIQSAVVVKGSMDKNAGEKDEGYTVEAAIPWAAFSKATNHPPKPFETWHLNFYAMKQNAGVAWSPILGQGNFHKAARFGLMTWAVPGMTPPAPSAAPSAAPDPAASGVASGAPNAPPGPGPSGARPFRPPFHGMHPRGPLPPQPQLPH